MTNLVLEQVTKVVGSEAGRDLVDASVRRAHTAALKLLEGDGLSPDSAFSVQDGEVVLDVVPLIVRTVELMQERGVISDRFDLTEIAQNVTSDEKVQTLARSSACRSPRTSVRSRSSTRRRSTEVSETLSTAQRALAIFQKATVVLVILALVMIGVSMVLSVDRRRTLAQLSIGIGVGAILMRIGIDRVVAAIDSAIEKAGPKAAAVQMTESLTEMLARTLVTLAIVGLAVGLIAYLLKPAPTAATRGSPASSATTPTSLGSWWWVSAWPSSLRWASSWITFIIVGALGVAGVLYVNRQSARRPLSRPDVCKTPTVTEPTSAVRRLVQAMPKAELHLHLDGCLRPQTALDLAAQFGVEAPTTWDGMFDALVAAAHPGSQAELLRSFELPLQLMQHREALARITTDLVEDKAADNVRYMELKWAPAVHLKRASRWTT